MMARNSTQERDRAPWSGQRAPRPTAAWIVLLCAVLGQRVACAAIGDRQRDQRLHLGPAHRTSASRGCLPDSSGTGHVRDNRRVLSGGPATSTTWHPMLLPGAFPPSQILKYGRCSTAEATSSGRRGRARPRNSQLATFQPMPCFVGRATAIAAIQDPAPPSDRSCQGRLPPAR